MSLLVRHRRDADNHDATPQTLTLIVWLIGHDDMAATGADVFSPDIGDHGPKPRCDDAVTTPDFHVHNSDHHALSDSTDMYRITVICDFRHRIARGCFLEVPEECEHIRPRKLECVLAVPCSTFIGLRCASVGCDEHAPKPSEVESHRIYLDVLPWPTFGSVSDLAYRG